MKYLINFCSLFENTIFVIYQKLKSICWSDCEKNSIMADAMVERRPPARFFCHKCNIEFEDVLQDYTCPYCAGGFIEQLENETEGSMHSGDDFSDADMSNLDDSDDVNQSTGHPVLNDLAFLMSGGRMRGSGRQDTLLEQLVFTIGGGAGPMGAGAVTAGAPLVLVGPPGDYVFGGEGLDAVVTQLLGQLENAGPPPLTRDQIAAIPSEAVSPEQAATSATCPVCWDTFQQGETISRLECNHIFHPTCIGPWLQLHATCPTCRHSLLTDDPAEDSPATPRDSSTTTSLARVLFHRGGGARRAARAQPHAWESGDSSGSASSLAAPAVTAGGVWAPQPRSAPDSADSTSSSSLNSSNDRERPYNMDIDFD